MAISEFSYGTHFIARSMSKSGSDNIRAALTGGSMPEEVRNSIVEKIQTEVENNNGKVPNGLYTEVAKMISPYAPMKLTTIEAALRASNFFGLTAKAKNVGTVGTTSGLDNYNKKRKEIEQRTTKTFSNQKTGGLVTDFAGVMTGAPPGARVDIVTAYQDIAPVSAYQIGSNEIEPGSNFVVSAEELEADMSSIRRDIVEIIVHFSETYQNANISKDDVPGGDGYHYIVHRNGAVQRSVPVGSAGKHTPGHDQYSIGVCLVGGLSVASGDKNVVEAVDASSITISQYNSLDRIFDAFYRIWPGGQALGHSEIDPNQNDPGFDVRDYVYSKFGKISLYENPDEEPALTPTDVHEKVVGLDGVEILDKDPDVVEKYQ